MKKIWINFLHYLWFTNLLYSNLRSTLLVRLLLLLGVDVRDRNGYTALLRTCRINTPKITKILLRRGADVNKKDFYHETPLIWASANGFEEIVELLLLQPMIDIDSIDDNGNNALIWASFLGNSMIVKKLVYAGADIDIRDSEGKTALQCAIEQRREDIIEFLTDPTYRRFKNQIEDTYSIL